MAKTKKRGASHHDSDAPAHFVPLAVIIDEYDGILGQYISATGAGDVVLTMPVTVDVAREGKQKFFVAVAVSATTGKCFSSPLKLSIKPSRFISRNMDSNFSLKIPDAIRDLEKLFNSISGA